MRRAAVLSAASPDAVRAVLVVWLRNSTTAAIVPAGSAARVP